MVTVLLNKESRTIYTHDAGMPREWYSLHGEGLLPLDKGGGAEGI
jgi:hypothetical protein